MDLSLVSIHDLFEEIARRSDYYVAAYQLANEPNQIIYTHWKDDVWFGNLALCAALQYDILHESHERVDEDTS